MKSGEGKRTDEELAVLSQSGDEEARDELLTRYFGVVRGRARGYFLVGGDSDDLIQEGMMGLYHAICNYRPDFSSFKNFAYLCINRRIIDAVKTYERKKHDPLKNYVSLLSGEWEDPTLSPDERIIEQENRREFLKKMSGVLSAFEFRVMVMYMDGFSLAEICEGTNKDVKSVDNAVQRAKKKLRSALSQKQ